MKKIKVKSWPEIILLAFFLTTFLITVFPNMVNAIEEPAQYTYSTYLNSTKDKYTFTSPIFNAGTGKTGSNGLWSVFIKYADESSSAYKLWGYCWCFRDITDLKLDFNTLHRSTLSQWVTALGGEYSFLNSQSGSKFGTVRASDGTSIPDRIRVLYPILYSAAKVDSSDASARVVRISITRKPSGDIKLPSSPVTAGQSANIIIKGNSYVFSSNNASLDNGIYYKFYVNSTLVENSSKNKSFEKALSYTFPAAGTYTLKLELTDGVARSTVITKTMNVGSGTLPPPPVYDSNYPPVARFSMASYAETGEVVNVTDQSYDPDGTIAGRYWTVSPSWGASPNLSTTGSGGTVIFHNEGTYTLTLMVTDNKGAAGSYSRDITIGSPPPPPPPKVEPNAAFSMPAQAGQGERVRVTNRSSDSDGYIVSSEWKITPSGAVEDEVGDSGGYLTFNQAGIYTVKLTVTDNDGLTDSTTKTIEITNEPPVAGINMNETVIQGMNTVIRSTSEDPEGKIASLEWSVIPQVGLTGTLAGEESTVYFDTEGVYNVKLKVTDKWGLSDEAEKTITVEPAIPEGDFQVKGARKQNRKLTLEIFNTLTVDRYPIQWERTEWQILPLTSGVTANDIKIDDASPIDKRDILFKKAGTYRIRMRIFNQKHASPWVEKEIEISPDAYPMADFYLQTSYLRDPLNENQVTFEFRDLSDSPDADPIVRRTWKYCFDSDNDGSFNDEAWVIFSDANELAPTFQAGKVGKYLVALEVREEFGEPTIERFVTPAERLKDDTGDEALEGKISEIINAAPFVNFEMNEKKKVDLVFTLGEVDAAKIANLNAKIESIVKSKLVAENIDAEDIYIQAISTNIIDSNAQSAQTIFSSWSSVEVPGGSSVSGGWAIEDNKVVTTSGYRPARAWLDLSAAARNTRDADISFTWGIKSSAGSFSHGEAGFIFRAQDSNNFYVYIMDNHSACGNIRYDQREALVKVTNGNFSVLSTHAFPSFYAGQSHNIRIVTAGSNIKVYRDNTLIFNVNDTAYAKGGYGFYVWDQYGAYFSNITIKTEVKKTLDQIIKEPSWRENSNHFLINISDVAMPELEDPTKSAYILSNLLDNDTYLAMLGTAVNQTQFENFIARNSGNGIFLSNSNMDAALAQLAEYVLSIIREKTKTNIKYVLLGEKVEYTKFYSDYEDDPQYDERWQYEHDPYWFENTLGQVPYHNQWIPEPVTVFDKVGKLNVNFQIKDEPTGGDDRFANYRLWSDMPFDRLNIFVHRKPIALYGIQLQPSGSSFTLTLTNNSYDLDHFSQENKGIVAGRWQWKEAGALAWTEGQPPAVLPPNMNYLISLRVQDEEGAWSDPAVQLITTKNVNLAPVANFVLVPNPLPVVKTAEVDDRSYDPNGDPIAERRWTVERTAGGTPGVVYTGSSLPVSFASYGVGEYKVTLEVRDNPRYGLTLWSEPYSQFLQVIPDNRAPVAYFTVLPNPVPQDVPAAYSENSSDPDGDPIVAREWRMKKTTASNWTSLSEPPTDFSAYGIGVYQIQLRVMDRPPLLQLDSKWSAWAERQLTVVPGNQKPVARFNVTPNPGVADEPVVYIDTSYDPEGLPLTERVWRIRNLHEPGVWYEFHDTLPPAVFETTGWGAEGDGTGTFEIGLKVKDASPNGLSPALWSEEYVVMVIIEDSLKIEGESDKSVYFAGEAMVLSARTEGRAYKVEAGMWWNGGNDFTPLNVTELVPANPVAGTPPKINNWKTRHDAAGNDYDRVVIIPRDMPDGTYQVEFTAYKTKYDGSIATATDVITVQVRGVQLNRIKTRIIS